MYRNIEFDAWNEARKESRLANWYTGDTNFKVSKFIFLSIDHFSNSKSELLQSYKGVSGKKSFAFTHFLLYNLFYFIELKTEHVQLH